MKNKIVKIAKVVFSIIFWVILWQILSMIVNHSYFLPSVPATFSALFSLFTRGNFYKAVIFSLIRVIIGLIFGVLFGTILAFLSYGFEIVKITVSPLISIIKATPVAAVIIILWVWLGGNVLSVLIAALMVMPIVYQNLMDGFSSINKELSEVALVYNFSLKKRIKLLFLPTLIKFLIPGVITSVGLAWKAEIATEIIAYTKDSIGYYINDAKFFYDTEVVFAWTVIIIAFSMLLEYVTKKLLRRFDA